MSSSSSTFTSKLRAFGILRLTVDQLKKKKNLKLGDEVIMKEKETGRERRITLTSGVLETATPPLSARNAAGHEWHAVIPVRGTDVRVMNIRSIFYPGGYDTLRAMSRRDHVCQ